MIRYVLTGITNPDQAAHVRDLWQEALRSRTTSTVVLGPGVTVQDLGPQRPMAAFLRRARARVR